MAKEFKEKTIVVNLKQVFQKPVTKRAINGKFVLKQIVTKETRLKDFSISNKINELFWAKGKYNCPRKMTVKVINEKGRAIVMLPEEKYSPKQDKKAENKKTESAPKAEAQAKAEEKKTEPKAEGKKSEAKK